MGPLLLLLATLLLPVLATAQNPPSRAEALKKLNLPKLADIALPTWYSAGAKARAERLQHFIAGERVFYRQQLGVRLDNLELAVLSPANWNDVSAPYPYGLPSVDGDPPVIVMPTDWSAMHAMPLPTEAEASPELRAQAMATGRTWTELMYTGADGIGAHELGHVIVKDYGIDPQVHWFSEFMASYIGDVYIAEKVPADLPANRIFFAAALSFPHPHTSLDYFNDHYEELAEKDPQNYGWYQVAMDERVIEVHKREGVNFIRKVKAAFPAGGPTLTSAQVLDKLETIDPGWKAWVARIESGK